MADALQIAIRNGVINAQSSAAGNQLGEQLVAGGLPRGTEMVRRGNAWATMSTSAVAALVVRPSTTAAFEIFNGHPSGGKSLVIDQAFWFELVSITLAEAASGWAAVTTAKAAPTSGAFVVRGSSGKSYGGPVIAAASTTVIDSGWFPWANLVMARPVTAAITPMGVAIADIDGRLIVPPQCSLCLHAVASVVGQTFTQGARWYEEQLTIE